MINSFKRLELFFWATAPCLITLLLVIFYLAPKHISGMGSFMPLLHLIPVYYWGMLHAREMPYWFVFAMGLVLDSATGSQLGLSSMLYIIFLALLHAQRKYIHKEGFVVKWGYFAALLLLVIALNWLTVSLLSSRLLAVWPALIQWLLTLCCYPLMHRLFDLLGARIQHRRWHLLHGH